MVPGKCLKPTCIPFFQYHIVHVSIIPYIIFLNCSGLYTLMCVYSTIFVTLLMEILYDVMTSVWGPLYHKGTGKVVLNALVEYTWRYGLAVNYCMQLNQRACHNE